MSCNMKVSTLHNSVGKTGRELKVIHKKMEEIKLQHKETHIAKKIDLTESVPDCMKVNQTLGICVPNCMEVNQTLGLWNCFKKCI